MKKLILLTTLIALQGMINRPLDAAARRLDPTVQTRINQQASLAKLTLPQQQAHKKTLRTKLAQLIDSNDLSKSNLNELGQYVETFLNWMQPEPYTGLATIVRTRNMHTNQINVLTSKLTTHLLHHSPPTTDLGSLKELLTQINDQEERNMSEAGVQVGCTFRIIAPTLYGIITKWDDAPKNLVVPALLHWAMQKTIFDDVNKGRFEKAIRNVLQKMIFQPKNQALEAQIVAEGLFTQEAIAEYRNPKLRATSKRVGNRAPRQANRTLEEKSIGLATQESTEIDQDFNGLSLENENDGGESATTASKKKRKKKTNAQKKAATEARAQQETLAAAQAALQAEQQQKREDQEADNEKMVHVAQFADDLVGEAKAFLAQEKIREAKEAQEAEVKRLADEEIRRRRQEKSQKKQDAKDKMADAAHYVGSLLDDETQVFIEHEKVLRKEAKEADIFFNAMVNEAADIITKEEMAQITQALKQTSLEEKEEVVFTDQERCIGLIMLWGALCKAAETNKPEVAQQLIDGNPLLKNNGESEYDFLKAFLNIRHPQTGDSVLHIALKKWNLDFVYYLLTQHRADLFLNITNNDDLDIITLFLKQLSAHHPDLHTITGNYLSGNRLELTAFIGTITRSTGWQKNNPLVKIIAQISAQRINNLNNQEITLFELIQRFVS